MLKGSIDNGRLATASFPFFTGPVGVCERTDTIELGFSGRGPSAAPPIDGTLDNEPVRVIAVFARDLDKSTLTAGRDRSTRAITLVVTRQEQR